MQQETLPVSFSQQRLWLMDQLGHGSSAYSIPLTARLRGHLSLDALQKSLQAIIERHEALRTTLTVIDTDPVQVVNPAPAAVDVPVTSVEHLPAGQKLEAAVALARSASERPFDLRNGPLFRVSLVRMSEDDHLLAMTMHQIVTDRRSSGILLSDLAAYYGAFLEGRDAGITPLDVQYGDYAKWQREWMTGDALREDVEFWKDTLRDAPPALALPTDEPRPAVQTHQGASLSFSIDAATTAELKRVSQEQAVTLFVTLLSAFNVLLRRYSDSDDILVGTPVAGRDQAELRNVVGLFANTVVIRSDLNGDPSFTTLLQRVSRQAAEAFAHQSTPFEKVVQELQPERSFRQAPVVQVMFSLAAEPESVSAASVRFEYVDVHTGTTPFDLEFEAIERENGELQASVTYNTDIFHADRIQRMAGHFRNLLSGIIRDPAARVSELPLLSPDERRTIVHEWNRTEAEYPSDICIHEMFEQQADRTPDAVALIGDDRQLTYRQVEEEANRLAWHLIGLGVTAGNRIGVCVERSIEAIVALLAVMKTGASYVPIDPAYPQQRIAFMLEDSKALGLITQHGLRSRLPEYIGTVVQYDRDHEAIRAESASRPEIRVESSDPAYTIYTSGSTGTPKGVVGSHRAALNRFSWMWKAYPFTSRDVACQKTSLSFVDSIWEMFGALLQGIPTYVVPDQAVRDPDIMCRALAAHNVTRIVVVPSFLRAILDTCGDLASRLPHLRFWVTSGEELPFELYRQFRTALPQARLINIYGSSEVAADVTWFDTALEEPKTFVPIGKPISNTRAYILDRHLNPLPTGVPGELYIGGDCLALGYLNRPELTAERFVADPFSDGKGRLFRTGDLARYAVDGNIEYLGRADSQVKVRGIRIELGEVETVLRSHDGIREAVVLVDPSGEQRLTAYCVPHPRQAIDVGQLRRFVRNKLPEHMLPSAFLFLDSLPLTPNGKVDRRSLPLMATAAETEREYTAPRNETETRLAGIWSEVLRLEPIGIHDNFFDLGGHSLSAVQVIARVRKAFGLDVPMRALFEEPTIAGFTAALEKAKSAGPVRTAPQITRRKDARSKVELLAKLNQMSEEDVEALLQSALEKRSHPAQA